MLPLCLWEVWGSPPPFAPTHQQSDGETLDGFNLLQTKGTAGHEERIFYLELHVSSHFLLITMGMILQDAEHWNMNAAGLLTHHTSNLCVGTPELFKTLAGCVLFSA